MDLTIIEKEISNFNRKFFYDISSVTEESLDFIKQNRLHIPKENYTIVGDFLSTTAKNFRILDSTFISSTLKKIEKDLRYIETLHAELLSDTRNTKEVFELSFINSSPSLTQLAREIFNTRDISEKKELSLMFKELSSVYYPLFEEFFNDDKKYYLSSLMKALNSKTYYFDKLLWVEASKSIVITKHFQVLKIKDALNTRDYLLYTIDLMRPYTKKYQYLQSCLRIYK